MNAESRKAWMLEHRCKADDAIRTVEAARKQRVSEYDERLRKLRHFAEELFLKCADGQLDLLDPSTVLSPELDKLLNDPLKGLE